MAHPKPKGSLADSKALLAEIAALKQGWQRSQADFENFRRRTQLEEGDRIGLAVGTALLALTPIAENFRRALAQLATLDGTASADQLAAWASGITTISRQFDQALLSAGLTTIQPNRGDPFNPHEHEALAYQAHPELASDTIVQVVERGYRRGQRILLPAKVVVSAGQPAPAAEPNA